MKITLFSIFILTLFIFSACNKKTENKTPEKPVTAKDLHVKLRDDYKYVNFIPDSLRTTEDRLLGITLGKTYMENVEVVNNRLVLKLKREDLKKYNIPYPYYEILLNELSDHNFYLDNNTDMVEMMLENFSFEKKKLYIAECQHLIDSLQNIINKK